MIGYKTIYGLGVFAAYRMMVYSQKLGLKYTLIEKIGGPLLWPIHIATFIFICIGGSLIFIGNPRIRFH